MTENLDVFHIMQTMRRLKPDAVAQDLLEEILDAAVCAPNSPNTQPYRFLVVRDRDSKAFFGERYDQAMTANFATMVPTADDNSRQARNIRTALRLGRHIKDVPVLLFIRGKRH